MIIDTPVQLLLDRLQQWPCRSSRPIATLLGTDGILAGAPLAATLKQLMKPLGSARAKGLFFPSG